MLTRSDYVGPARLSAPANELPGGAGGELRIAFEEGRKNPLVIGGAQYTPAMSFKDIADRLGMTKQSVWNTYAVALEKIRRQIRIHPKMFGALLSHREISRGETLPDHDLE